MVHTRSPFFRDASMSCSFLRRFFSGRIIMKYIRTKTSSSGRRLKRIPTMPPAAESVVTAAGSAAPVVVVSATAVAMPKSLVRNSMRISSFQ